MKHLVWIALAGAAACSDANVAGNYTAAITNRADGCSIGWAVGESSTGIELTVTQSGSDVTLMVNPLSLPGVFLGGLLGTNSFQGEVDGDDVSLSVKGMKDNNISTCTFKFNADIDAVQDGDTMTGRVEYRAATNGDDACGSRTGCLSVQEFNATRAPR